MTRAQLAVMTSRERLKMRGMCVGSADREPAPGEVGLDLRASCPVCKRRIAVTEHSRYAIHMPRRRKQ
jgi:hypothetical protein